jgi:hypothetical protein
MERIFIGAEILQTFPDLVLKPSKPGIKVYIKLSQTLLLVILQNKRYDEGKHYNYNNPGFTHETGHFTQLVWKSTTSVGCARCGGRGAQWYETYVVCDYKPPGNVVSGNQFRENVLLH